MATPLLAAAAALYAQQPAQQPPLSFQPGGPEACAHATGIAVPSPQASSAAQRTAGYSCAEYDLALEKTRLDKLSKAAEAFPSAQRVAFNALTVSFEGFRDARLANETCFSGNGCGESKQHARVLLNLELLQLLEDAPPAPATSLPDELTSADAALNALYDELFAHRPETCTSVPDTCPSQSMLRDTQRAWIRFRDAWVTFAALRYPAVPADLWLTLLTRQRTHELETLRSSVN